MKARWITSLLSVCLFVVAVVASERPANSTESMPSIQQTIDYINSKLTAGDLDEHKSRLSLSSDHLILYLEYSSRRDGEELQIKKSIPVLSVDVATISAQSTFVLPCKNENCVALVWKQYGTTKTMVAEPTHELVIRSFLPDPYVRQNIVRAFTHLVDLVDQEEKLKSNDKSDPFRLPDKLAAKSP